MVDPKYLTPQSRSLTSLQGNPSKLMNDAYHVKVISKRVIPDVYDRKTIFKHEYPFPRRERKFLPRGLQN